MIEKDPFVTLDIDGVGELVRIATERAGPSARHQARHLRRAWRRPGLGGFCESIGLDYVSPARRSACRSPGWPRPRRRSRKAACLTNGSFGRQTRSRAPKEGGCSGADSGFQYSGHFGEEKPILARFCRNRGHPVCLDGLYFDDTFHGDMKPWTSFP
jgi:hypothetical protein